MRISRVNKHYDYLILVKVFKVDCESSMPTHRMTKYRRSWCIKLGKVFTEKFWQFFNNIVIHSPVLPFLLSCIKIKPSSCIQVQWTSMTTLCLKIWGTSSSSLSMHTPKTAQYLLLRMVLKEKVRFIKLAEKADIKDTIQNTSRFLLHKIEALYESSIHPESCLMSTN